VKSNWGVSDNNRKAKFYSLTAAGRRQARREAQGWLATTDIVARFLAPEPES
jgi:DNA-binding PadR family transcriptional regulator